MEFTCCNAKPKGEYTLSNAYVNTICFLPADRPADLILVHQESVVML
jgi:hypothetical protein